jgi:hypothetical protein
VGKKMEVEWKYGNGFKGMEVSSDRLGGWSLRESSQTLSGFIT